MDVEVTLNQNSLVMYVKLSDYKKVEAENEKLKKALTMIMACANEHCNNFEDYNDHVFLTASEALTPEGE